MPPSPASTPAPAARLPLLVIDVRANEGGDGAIGGEVLSYLLRKPFEFFSTQSTSAYERVPASLARYLDTWDKSFFDRTGKVEKITEGTAAGKYRYTERGDGRQTITPVASPYPDASVTPDIEVVPSLQARRAGRDVDVEAVQQLVAAHRRK